MTSQKYHIAILDSGVGGLSIFKSISQRMPQLSIIYACDNKNFPYGPKPEGLVTQCISNLTEKVIRKFSPRLFVIACNTASTVALNKLRALSPVPVVGVVPAIKPASFISATKVIGLLATPGTISRDYTDRLIQEHAKDTQVIKLGSTLLVEMAEKKLRGIHCDLESVRQELVPFFPAQSQSPIDTIVLGCTHFPLLLDELKATTPKPINWIDSSEAIAQRVSSLSISEETSAPTYTAVFSELNDGALSLKPYLQSLQFSNLEEIS